MIRATRSGKPLLAMLIAVAMAVSCSDQEQVDYNGLDPRRGMLEASNKPPKLYRFDNGEADLKAFSTAPSTPWSVKDGELFTPGSRNKTLWLKDNIPPYVRIEFEARCETEGGDIRLEVFGDGEHHESGYVLLFGAWRGSAHVIARFDEHSNDRVLVESDAPLEVGRTYKMTIIRTDQALRWFVDGKLLVDYNDPEPLTGPGHEHFGFGTWKSQVVFDNITIFELQRRG